MAGSLNTGVWRRLAVTVSSGAIITVLLLFASRSTVDTMSELTSVELGLPLAWTTQDQSYFSPAAFPYQASFVSPWEHPTTVNLPMLLADLLVVSGALWVLGLAWRRARSAPGRRHPALHDAVDPLPAVPVDAAPMQRNATGA